MRSKTSLQLLLILLFGILNGVSSAQTISITTLGSAYTQNFDALSNTAGSTTNNLTITGWFMTESGGGTRDNEQYAVDAGGSTTGDTYSYGATASTERALGQLRSGTLISIFGAAFINNTGSTITSLTIGYTGEEWRLGTAGRTDQMNFEYSTNATDLTTGTWVNAAALNFVTPDITTGGAKNGNVVGERTALNTTITGLSIPNGATFWIRWTDTDATGADDGLAVDDFSLTAAASPPGAALNFDGADDYVKVTNSSVNLANSSFSVEMWLQRGTPGTGDIAFFQGGNINSNQSLHIGFRDNGNFTFAFYNNDLDVTGLSDALWHHWACTFDNVTKIQKVYRDGVLVGQRIASSSFIGSGNTDLIIGNAAFIASNAPNFFNGNIDEVRVWSTVRTCDQISQLRNCELTGSESGLLAYYKFNQGTAGGNNAGVTTLTDATANHNDGTLNNFALTGATSNWVAPGGVTSGVSCPSVITAPEINVQGNGNTIDDGDVTPSVTDNTDFGNVNSGSNSVKTFTVQNTGNAPLMVTGITVTGTNASSFTPGALTPASPIPQGSSATFTLTFTPTSTGLKTATVHIASNDCDEGDYDFAVQGTGTTAVSTNADLSNLTISQGTLTPTFTTGNINYTDAVDNSVTSVTVTPTKADAGASIQVRVNGGGYTTVTSGSPSSPLTLNVGNNTIEVKVTAADGVTTKTYTIVVNRGAAGNNFYVSTTGDDHNNGSSVHPFKTLQHANDTSIVHNGDIINVLAGDYTEFVDVTKSLRFYGPNKDISPNSGSRNAEAVLHASSTPVYPHDANGTTVFEAKTSGTNIEVKGFKLMGGNPIHDGHYHRTAGSPQDIIILFEKNWVSNADHLFAGTLTKWKTVTIRDNLFQNINSSANVSSAIQLNDEVNAFTPPTYAAYAATVTATIEDNVINTTEFAGILLDNIATASVQRNKLSNMKGEAGIQLAGGIGNATVSMNEIDHANTASAAGNDDGAIKIYGSDFTGTVNITNNIVTTSLNGFVVKSGQNISGKSIAVNNNSFDGTTITNKVIYNAGTGTLAATCNWYNITPCGSIGARISGAVTFDPSLNSGTDTYPATIGFQPVPGSCASCSASITVPTPEVHLYPVPVIDMLKIKYTSPEQSKVSITIIDEVGRVAQRENTVVMKGINVMSFSVQKLYKGVYTVIIDNGKTQTREKMIKL